MKTKTFRVLLAFLVMGIADAMGPMASAVEKNYELSAVVATLLTFFVFIAFAVFSVPGGTLAGRIGKKNLLLLGLGLYYCDGYTHFCQSRIYSSAMLHLPFRYWHNISPSCRKPNNEGC